MKNCLCLQLLASAGLGRPVIGVYKRCTATGPFFQDITPKENIVNPGYYMHQGSDFR